MLPSPANKKSKVHYGLTGWPSFIHRPRARMMDETNVPAASRSQGYRVTLTVDIDLSWTELVWQ